LLWTGLLFKTRLSCDKLESTHFFSKEMAP
jgi:hypothetical protein